MGRAGPGDWWLVKSTSRYPSAGCSTLFPPVTNGWKEGGARYGLATGSTKWGASTAGSTTAPRSRSPNRSSTRARPRPHGDPDVDAVARRGPPLARRGATARRRRQPRAAAGDPALDDDAVASTSGRRSTTIFVGRRCTSSTPGSTSSGACSSTRAAGGGRTGARLRSCSPARPRRPRRSTPTCSASRTRSTTPARRRTSPRSRTSGGGRRAGPAVDAYLDDYGWRPVAGHDPVEPTGGTAGPRDLRSQRSATGGERRGRGGARRRVDIRPGRTGSASISCSPTLAPAMRCVTTTWACAGTGHSGSSGEQRSRSARGSPTAASVDAHHVFEADTSEALALLAGTGRQADDWPAAGTDECAPPRSRRSTSTAVGRGPTRCRSRRPSSACRESATRCGRWRPHPSAAHPSTASASDRERRARRGWCSIPTTSCVSSTATCSSRWPRRRRSTQCSRWCRRWSPSTAACSATPRSSRRELGLPAVVGVADVFEGIHDGDLIEVDPVAGTVRVSREGHCCTRAIVNNVATARPDSVRTWLAAVHSRRKRFQYAGVSLPFHGTCLEHVVARHVVRQRGVVPVR